MTRSLGLIGLVLTLAIGGYLFAQQAKTNAPTSQATQQEEAQASAAASATSFDAALPTLQAWYADHGTYAGAALPPSYGVTLVRGDATSFCLQSADGQTHETGPNGAPAAGPC
jgi:ABC-type transport system substrate-binding protein